MPTDFSIDSILSKPKTDFSIAHILGLQEGGASSASTVGASSSKKRSNSQPTNHSSPKRHRRTSGGDSSNSRGYLVLNSHISRYHKFGMVQHVTECVLRNPTGTREAALGYLERAFTNLMNEAYEREPKSEMVAVIIESDNLQGPIPIPPRSREQNTPEAIVRKIDETSSSATAANLLYSKMRVIITTLTPPENIQKPSGTGFNPRNFFGVDLKYMINVVNDDKFCLFYALEFSRLYNEHTEREELKKVKKPFTHLMYKKTFKKLIDPNNENSHYRRVAHVRQLMRALDIPQNCNNYGEKYYGIMQAYYDQEFPGLYRIVVFDENPELKPLWKGPSKRKYEVPVYLTMNDQQEGHYDGIKDISNFFFVKNYCVDCEVSWSNATHHRLSCITRCPRCCSIGPEYPCISDGKNRKCNDCKRIFVTTQCFENHQKNGCCRLYKFCELCHKSYKKEPEFPHVCGEERCRQCHVFHDPKRSCYITPLSFKKDQEIYRMVFFDFECSQDKVWSNDVYQHVVNFVSARVACRECKGNEEECLICGKRKHLTWSGVPTPQNPDPQPLYKFVDWLLNAFDKEYDTVIYAHYGGRYDHHFVLNRLYELGLRPNVIIGGCKIYEVTVKLAQTSKLIFRDSHLIMPVKLADLPKTFGLTTEAKMYFPHMYNKAENYSVRLPHLPPVEDYVPDSMMPDDRKKFEQWYEKNRTTPFFLPEELDKYCANDTQILKEAVMKMSIKLREITKGYDVLRDSSTIAGVCMKIFRGMFLKDENGKEKKDHLSIVPEGGYERNDRQSKIALQYLQWRVSKGEAIQHAGNGGEHIVQVGKHKYKLDGYIKAEKKAIEFLGCYYHGCPECMKRGTETCVNGRPASEMLKESRDRIEAIRKHPDVSEVEEVWECTLRKMLKADKQMAKELEDQPDVGYLDPRQGYFGGRTGPQVLLTQVSEGKRISMADIVSLYPYVNYKTEYPVGVPDIIIPEPLTEPWTKPEHISHKGLLKVRIIPPTDLRIPVMPLRTERGLMFPLCATCAKQDLQECNHSDEKRAFIATTAHIELEEALRQGYVVDRVYRIWHYTQWDTGLFKEYVKTFLKLKVEASGWPSNVKADADKEQYITAYNERYGIGLNKAELDKGKNAGMRFISKLCLNSLWGKFSMRNDLAKSEVVTNAGDFYEKLFDPTLDVRSIIPVTFGKTKSMRLVYKKKKDFIEEHSVSNVVISLWTTSAARLELYRHMRTVDDAPGCRLLYTDTDSVVYEHPEGINPLKSGEFLGEMTMEYDDSRIQKWACGGPKQYAMELEKLDDGTIWHKIKVRGMTLDDRNSKELQFEKFWEMTENHGNGEKVKFYYPRKFGPTKESLVLAKDLYKDYGMVCTKGSKLLYVIYPHGYFRVKNC